MEGALAHAAPDRSVLVEVGQSALERVRGQLIEHHGHHHARPRRAGRLRGRGRSAAGRGEGEDDPSDDRSEARHPSDLVYHAWVHVPTARAPCYSRSVPSPRARRGSLLAVLLAACGPSTLGPPLGPPCAPGTICTVAGTGEPGIGDDGLPAHRTPLYLPVDVEIGPDGRLYVVDFNNHRVLAVDEDRRRASWRARASSATDRRGPPSSRGSCTRRASPSTRRDGC
ncbi:MAG: hypothetical protein M5U28_07630 [Sandaracinaceae bacterium]|nr:hypothetical protein [Sandaracinaceae bacterium]